MIWIVLGVLLWSGAHFFKRIAPEARANMGNAGKGVVALGSIVGIVLMVIGYRSSDYIPLWDLGPAAMSINNSMMVIAVVLFGVGSSKSRLRGKLRHPMLTGVIIWAIAHLLVNGDVSSLLLFGGMGLWALVSIVLINRAEPVPEPFTGGSAAGDIRLFLICIAVFVVIAAIHTWLGYWPFPG